MKKLDFIFVGGGLANTLAAFRLSEISPGLNSLVLESENTLGGNHTWSFHDADLGDRDRAWLTPFVTKSWSRQHLEFPHLSRTLATGYHSIRSDRFHRVAMQRLNGRVRLKTRVKEVAPHKVTLTDGRELSAEVVMDGRGWDASENIPVGYQKFFGQTIRTSVPHGLAEPILMDARGEQSDGFQFFYLLPFSESDCLVEDTYYSESSGLDTERSKNKIADYARSRGWQIDSIVHEETGVLPIPLAGNLKPWTAGVSRSGLRAGLFHATTGYSIAPAVRFASRLAELPSFTSEKIFAWSKNYAQRHWQKQSFFRRLNRMMFQAAEPNRRYEIFEKFYRLPVTTVERFYASELTLSDRARIFLGKPPVPLLRAIRSVREKSF